MNALNFTIKADWIERINTLLPEQRTLIVMAIYDYMVYGKLSKNDYVNFATSWIRDEIDRMKKAAERREARRRARIEEEKRIAEEQKAAAEEEPEATPEEPIAVPEESAQVAESEQSAVAEPEPATTKAIAKTSPPWRGITAKPSRPPKTPKTLNFRDFKRQRVLFRRKT